MTGSLRILGLLVVLIILAAGCSNEVENPGGLPSLPPQPDTPRDLYVMVGDGQVTLNWAANRPETIQRYKIYTSDAEAMTGMRFLDSTTEQTYDINNLINGQRYYFRVSAVDDSGLEGEMSDPVAAVPGVFSIAIENYKDYTKSRQVNINLIAPSGTELVELSEDAGFVNNFRLVEFNNIVQYELSDGDGVKTVFARFELLGGGASIGAVSDSIILDRIALIDSVVVSTAGGQIQPGGLVHFAVYVTETGGEAAVKIGSNITVQLNDRGISGDAAAEDGIYEIDYIVPVNTVLNNAAVTGSFTDAAGNQAPSLTASTTLTVVNPPLPVQLSGFAKSSSIINLQWTQSAATDFTAYRLFRSTADSVNQSSYLAATITQASTTTYIDADLEASTTYYYRLYVYDSNGNSAGSDSLGLTTSENPPPAAVTLAARLTGDTLSVELSWEKSEENDFKSYHILRDTSPLPAGYDATKVIKVISIDATTIFADKVPANGTHYYQVYVFDVQGEMTGSNTVSINVP